MVVTRIEPLVPSATWRYVSRGAWQIKTPDARIEFVLSSGDANPIHVETIAMVANFHADPRYRVYPGKIINIGRPWIEGASCDHLLVSLPYLLGPDFENLRVDDVSIRFLWLLPITRSEASYARANGVEALERVFEESKLDTIDPGRDSVV
jgi:Suppressor of fused protein (SUFU)